MLRRFMFFQEPLREAHPDPNKWASPGPPPLSKFFIRAQGAHFGYPHFTRDYINRFVDKPDTEQRELHEFELTNKPKRIRNLLIVASFLMFIKISLWALCVFLDVDLKNPDLSLEKISASNLLTLNRLFKSDEKNPPALQIFKNSSLSSSSSSFYKLSCLLTNCTSFNLTSMGPKLLQGSEEFARDLKLRGRSETKLAFELLEVPYFSICHPILSTLHDPTQYLDYEGLFLSSIAAWLVGLVGSILPLLEMLRPTGNLMILFLAAPKVTRRIVRDRARSLYLNLGRSYENYRACFVAGPKARGVQYERAWRAARDEAKAARGERSGGGTRLGPEQSPKLAAVEDLHRELLRNRRSNKLHKADDLGLDELAEDCLPAMRSAWWHKLGARIFERLCLFGVISLSCSSLGVVLAINFAVDVRRKRFRALARQVQALNCAVWNVDQGDQPLDLDRVMDLNPWWALSMTGLLVVSAWPIILLALYITTFYVTNIELSGWLNEVRFELQMAHEFSNQLCMDQWQWPIQEAHTQLHKLDRRGRSSEDWLRGWPPRVEAPQVGVAAPLGLEFKCHTRRLISLPTSRLLPSQSMPRLADQGNGGDEGAAGHGHRIEHRFNLEELRIKFMSLTWFPFVFVRTEDLGPTRLTDSLGRELYVRNSIRRHEMDLDSLVEMLQKVYVSFRILAEHLDEYAPTISGMTVYINCYVFALIAMGLWYIRRVANFVYLPVMITFVNWFFVDMNLIIASNFHAKAQQLHPLIYGMIAHASQCSDLRVMHIQSLWLKQIKVIDFEGGLALRANSVRITYSRVIRLIVATSTVIIFILGL